MKTTTLAEPLRHQPRNEAAIAASLDGVTKRFGSTLALDAVSVGFPAGRVTALLGPNGAGKTTAVRILLGLTRPDLGRASLFGRPPADTAARTRVGVMLQVGRVPHTLRVSEHLRLFSSYYPSPLPIDQVVSLAGLGGLERRSFGQLSGGQQQRLLFALAICGDPDFLVLDEPTSSLDVEARRAMWGTIRAWTHKGGAVLLTTHDLAEAEALADHVIVLQRGRVIRSGTAAEVAACVAQASITCLSSLPLPRIHSLPGVVQAEAVGRSIRIVTTAPESTAAALLRDDPALSELQISRARLEDAFLALTTSAGLHSSQCDIPGSRLWGPGPWKPS